MGKNISIPTLPLFIAHFSGETKTESLLGSPAILPSGQMLALLLQIMQKLLPSQVGNLKLRVLK